MALILTGVIGTAVTANAADEIAYSFAECAGRFSAEMEHAWLLNDPAASAIERDRSTFVSLTRATHAPGAGRAILSHRIEVKLAHAALLQRASFATHQDIAQSARRTANQHLAACRALLLGS